MVKFTTSIYERLIDDLKRIHLDAHNILQESERSLIAIQEAIRQIKKFILEHTFKDKAEEIKFFKDIKPQFLSLLIYYTEVYAIESHKPIGTTYMVKQYYDTEMERVKLYFLRNQMFYNYHRSGKTVDDELFFLRESQEAKGSADSAIEMDSRFCTVYSYKLSKLQAFEQVNEYLQKCVYKIEHPETFISDNGERKFSNSWTDSKAALIELAYALQARGAINNGKSDIKQIITDLEIVFNVELGNFYRTFQNMRIRKKNVTPFLDVLKQSLEKKMEENY